MDRLPRLRVPRRTVGLIVDEVARYGHNEQETGGFLVAPASDPDAISGVVIAGDHGIERGWGAFRISEVAVDALFAWVNENGLRIRAQFHSHRGGSGLSPIDRREGFNVCGFVSCVVPQYGRPTRGLRSWGWWLFDGSSWVWTWPPVAVSGPVAGAVFDEDGVRPHG